MANTIKIKRGSGSDPAASDMVLGEPVLRTDTAELFFKKDDGSVAKVSGGGGGPDFKYLALRNAANNGAASFPNADFTLVTSGTTTAITPTAANTLLVSVNGVIQKPNTGTSTPSAGFAISGSTIKFGANLSAAPDFILYQESGGIGEPSDETVSEAKLKVSNSPVNGYFLSAQSGNTGGLTWAAPVATSCTGNSATATALATARAINGVNFDGTAAITVTAAAGTLSGNTLNSSVTASSLTSLGDLAGLTVNGDMALTGANYNVLWDKSDNALEFADNAKATFGTGNDLRIYHDGNNSYINDIGTGSLVVTASTFAVNNAASTEQMMKAVENGAVELNYDGSKKFETLTDGVKISGKTLSLINPSNFQDSTFTLEHGSSTVGNKHTIDFKDQNGSSTQIISYGSAFGSSKDNALEIKTSTTSNGDPTTRLTFFEDGKIQLPDNGKATFGAGDDLQIYHDGTDSIITNSTGDLQITDTSDDITITAADDIRLRPQGGENGINVIGDGAVELYHDNSKKFETLSNGTQVTGRLGVDKSPDTRVEVKLSVFTATGNDDASDWGADGIFQLTHQGTQAAGSEVLLLGAASGAVGQIASGFGFGRESTSNWGTFISFKTHSTSTSNIDELIERWRITSAGHLENNSDTGRFKLGASDDLHIYHDGTDTYVSNATGDLRLFSVGGSADDVMIRAQDDIQLQPDNGDNGVNIIGNGAVELYYDNSKKFETLSDGVNVTGTLKVNGSALAGGKVIQQVSSTKLDTASNSTGSQSTWEFNDSSLRVQITGSSTSNKFLFLGQVTVGGEISTHIGLRDGESNSNVTGMMATGTGNRRASTSGKTGSDSHAANTVPIIGLINVPDTNQHTYYFQFSHTSGSTQTLYINTGSNTGDNAERGRYISHLTVLEISA